MKMVKKYYHEIKDLEIEVECPFYVEILHEVTLSSGITVLGVIMQDEFTPNPLDDDNLDDSLKDSMYEMWSDGDVWGCGVWMYDGSGHLMCRNDECWGLYGRDYAETQLELTFNSCVKGLKKVCRGA